MKTQVGNTGVALAGWLMIVVGGVPGKLVSLFVIMCMYDAGR